ncbi:MAG: hypothetical protein CMF52_02660 [Legionellales bacterium]|nr:hypothetical protein [Legionellales bacterium]
MFKKMKNILGKSNRYLKVLLLQNTMSWHHNAIHMLYDFLLAIKAAVSSNPDIEQEFSDAAVELKNKGFVVFDIYEENEFFTYNSAQVAKSFESLNSTNTDLQDLGVDRLVDSLSKHPSLIKILDYPAVKSTLSAYYRNSFRVFTGDVFRTHKANPDSNESLQSLKYHRDNMPKSGVKVFVYLSDVTKETGSITLSPKSIAKKLGRRGVYLRDEISRYHDEIDAQSTAIEGKKGCIILFTPHTVIHRAVLPLSGFRDVVSFVVHPTLGGEVNYDASELKVLSKNQGYLINPFRFKALRIGDQ